MTSNRKVETNKASNEKASNEPEDSSGLARVDA